MFCRVFLSNLWKQFCSAQGHPDQSDCKDVFQSIGEDLGEFFMVFYVEITAISGLELVLWCLARPAIFAYFSPLCQNCLDHFFGYHSIFSLQSILTGLTSVTREQIRSAGVTTPCSQSQSTCSRTPC